MTPAEIGSIVNRLRLPPGFVALVFIENDDLRKSDTDYEIQLNYTTADADGILPRVTISARRVCHGQYVYHTQQVVNTVHDLLLQLYAHEIDEWLRLDGERVRDPHPELRAAR